MGRRPRTTTTNLLALSQVTKCRRARTSPESATGFDESSSRVRPVSEVADVPERVSDVEQDDRRAQVVGTVLEILP